jgi:PAS domain S-box-containing protein
MDPEDNSKDKLDELRVELRRCRAIIGASGIGYVILDEKGTVLDASPQYVASSGHSSLSEIVGRAVTEWIRDGEREGFRRAMQTCLKDGSIRNFETSHIDANGEVTALLIDAIVEHGSGADHILAVCRDNTAHKQKEEQWLRQEQFTEAVFQSAPFLVYEYDDRLQMIRWNKQAEEITGFDSGELFRKNLFSWFADDEVPLVAAELARLQKNGYASVKARLTMKDGRRVPYYFTSVSYSVDGRQFLAGVGIDLTESELAERALRESEARLSTLIEKAPLPIGVGRQGFMIYANSAYAAMLGAKSVEMIVGLPVLQQFAPGSRDAVREYVQKRDLGLPAPSEYETVGLRFDGTQFPVHVAITRVQLADGPVSLAFCTDITERQRAKDDLAQANEQLRLERETLRQKNIALQELLGQVSESRRSVGTQIQSNIRTIVLPILERLAVRVDAPGKHLLSLAQNSLGDIVSPFVGSLEARSHKLTQHDIELCELIRRGHGSKEIAELRGCSVQTVIKQRKTIRRKLGITGKEVNLASYLNGVMADAGLPESRTRSK